MPALTLTPALSLLAALTRFSPAQPVHTFFRATGYRLRPPRPVPHTPVVTQAQSAVLARGEAAPHQRATLLCERRFGNTPTIVLGGFVPDATEQVFLLRGYFLRRGSVYYLNYPRGGFSPALICAQLDDLVEELSRRHGQRPVVFGVSFGAGLALDWLRRARAAGLTPDIAGLVLVSPVACAADIVVPGEAKASTLIGRALKPYLDSGATVGPEVIDRSRTIFAKMFEAGAQNREALRSLMTVPELHQLRDRVLAAIQSIDARGACERVNALRDMPPLSPWNLAGQLPLTAAPTLVLYAEKETAVIAAGSPTRLAFESALRSFFPRGELRTVAGGGTNNNPVQHASLIFHYFQFLPPVAAFYRHLKSSKLPLAA
jgi:pimeloyl-ACP methyl ester carboxylesterase